MKLRMSDEKDQEYRAKCLRKAYEHYIASLEALELEMAQGSYDPKTLLMFGDVCNSMANVCQRRHNPQEQQSYVKKGLCCLLKFHDNSLPFQEMICKLLIAGESYDEALVWARRAGNERLIFIASKKGNEHYHRAMLSKLIPLPSKIISAVRLAPRN